MSSRVAVTCDLRKGGGLRFRGGWLLLVAGALVAGACDGDGTAETTLAPPATTTVAPTTTTTSSPTTPSTTSTTTSPPTTTTAPATSTTTTASTTTTTADRRYVVGELGLYPRPGNSTEPLSGSEGAGGSGCAPGSTGLPGGIWFGLVTAKADTSITFDLACFFFGPIAVEEGANDGIFVDPIGEVYIRNSNSTVRTITVDRSVPVYEYFEDLTDTIEIPFNSVSFADWPQDPTFSQPCPGKFCGVWLFVNGGAVTEMLEQFFAPCVGSSTSNCVPVVW